MLEVSSLTKYFGRQPALKEVSLQVRENEVVVVVGPNGAGKTTLLNSVAGLVRPDRGRIIIGGETVFLKEGGKTIIDVPPEKRRVGLVPQDYALFPHLTVKENIELAMRARGCRPDGEERMKMLIEMFGLEGLLERKPRELSGGERQRVALARVMASKSRVILLDEPLESIDPLTRPQIRKWLKKALKILSAPTLIVTHDLDDAWILGDKIVILNRGEVMAQGPLHDIIHSSSNPLAAQFLGYNVLRATIKEKRGGEVIVDIGGESAKIQAHMTSSAGEEVMLIFGPGDVAFGDEPDGLSLTVRLVEETPSRNGFTLELETHDGQRIRAEVPKAIHMKILRKHTPREVFKINIPGKLLSVKPLER